MPQTRLTVVCHKTVFVEFIIYITRFIRWVAYQKTNKMEIYLEKCWHNLTHLGEKTFAIGWGFPLRFFANWRIIFQSLNSRITPNGDETRIRVSSNDRNKLCSRPTLPWCASRRWLHLWIDYRLIHRYFIVNYAYTSYVIQGWWPA